MMRFDVITVFPEFVQTVVRYGVTGRAVEQKNLEVQSWNPRDFTHDRHHTVDDRPYGGGPGMVMKVQPLEECLQKIKALTSSDARVVLLSPQGKTMTQADVKRFATLPNMILIAGRYEGIDERFVELEVDEEWSIGDYVLSGGELPAMVMIDAVARMLPGVLGDADSAQQDSFMEGLLDCPHYTRPEVFADLSVPSVLIGGDHKEIEKWRRKQALGRTWERRPDLLMRLQLNAADQKLLHEYQQEQHETE